MLPAGAPGRSSLDARPSKPTRTPAGTVAPVESEQLTGHGVQATPGAEHVKRAIGSPAALAADGSSAAPPISASASSRPRLAAASIAPVIVGAASRMRRTAPRD
jgi:hypothetical protein